MAKAFREDHLAIISALIFGALMMLVMGAYVSPDVSAGRLQDTDSYIRIVQLREALAHGGLRGGFMPRDNAPFGNVMHWTSLYDWFILCLYGLGALIFGASDKVLVTAGALSGPLTYILLMGIVAWLPAPLVEWRGRVAAAIMSGLAFAILSYGMYGRADHHVAVLCGWAALAGFGLRLALQPSPRAAIGWGIAFALTLWTSVECTAAILVVVGLMGLVTAWRGGRHLQMASLATFLGIIFVLIAYALDVPPAENMAIDRLSFIFLAFAALIGFAFVVPSVAEKPFSAGPGVRVACLVVTGLFLCGVWLLMFPQLIAGPETLIGPELTALWWDKIRELQPINRTADTLLFLGAALVGLPAAIWLAWRAKGEARVGWSLIVIGIIALTLPGVAHLRFSSYPVLMGAIAAAVAMTRLARLAHDAASPPWNISAGAGVVLGFLMGPPILGLYALYIQDEVAKPAVTKDDPTKDSAKDSGDNLVTASSASSFDAPQISGTASHAKPPKAVVSSHDPDKTGKPCDPHGIADALAKADFFPGAPIVMSEVDFAPELLYWTRASVVAGPYQRNKAGLTDVYAFYGARNQDDDKAARAILRHRGIARVLVCQTSPITDQVSEDPKAETLYARLLDNRPPTWLSKLKWPAGTETGFALYGVVDP